MLKPPIARRGARFAAWSLALGLACAPSESATPAHPVPSVDEWPSPNPNMNMLARGQGIGRALEQQPPLLDELEFTDGRRTFVTVVEEGDGWLDVLMEGETGVTQQRIDAAEVAALHRATPDEALQRRLAHLVRIEAMVDGARPAAAPASAGAAPAAESVPPAPVAPKGVWNLEDVSSLAALSGAQDVRWWPGAPDEYASSAVEAQDPVFGRRGVWALLATDIGHDDSVGLQVTIAAERVVFEHSPGFAGASMDQLHGHWRLLVDGELRWEYFAKTDADLANGRYPYESTPITLGPGQHTVTWELEGCDSAATYFWIIDTIEWRGVTPPQSEPTWGALGEE